MSYTGILNTAEDIPEEERQQAIVALSKEFLLMRYITPRSTINMKL